MGMFDKISSVYRVTKHKCPVCGEELERAYIVEDSICTEDYSYCDNCKYVSVMCFSSTMIGMPEDYNKRYESEVKDQEIDVLPYDEYNRLFNMLPY